MKTEPIRKLCVDLYYSIFMHDHRSLTSIYLEKTLVRESQLFELSILIENKILEEQND